MRNLKSGKTCVIARVCSNLLTIATAIERHDSNVPNGYRALSSQVSAFQSIFPQKHETWLDKEELRKALPKIEGSDRQGDFS
jgi:hypothetical protein